MKPSTSNPDVAALLNQAASLSQQEKLQEALLMYQQALSIEPDNFDAHYNAGKALHNLKQYDEALAHYKQAVVIDPDNALVYNSLGIILKEIGRHEDALRSCERAILLRPDFAEAYYNRGNALGSLGLFEQALASYERAISLKPDYAEACYKQGLALQHLKRYEDALACYGRAISLKSDYAKIYNSRGSILQQLNRHEEALANYDEAISLKPDYAHAYYNRGIVLHHLKRYEEALTSYDRAISLKPEYVDSYNNRGIAFKDMNRYEEALASYDQAISFKPDYAEAFNNRGIVLKELDRYEEAIESYGRAISINPDYADPYYNLGLCLRHLHRHEEALDNFNKTISINPDFAYVYGYRLELESTIGQWKNFERHVEELMAMIANDILASPPFPLLNFPTTPKLIQKCALLLVAHKYPPATRPICLGERYNHKRIRIGYFSADFFNHATAYLMAELFELHDRSRFEIFAFSFGSEQDGDMRARLVKSFDHFFDVSKQSDTAIAKQARNLEIDIAVDLKGFTNESRPGIFAQRPSPIQVNYLGYPGTMGASFIDYIIADPMVIPKDQFEFYTEKVVQLPHCYQVNDSRRRIADNLPTRSELDLPGTGFVFCCFNNNLKITPDVFTIWMRLLAKVKGSVLWLFQGNAAIQRNLRREAQQRNIDPDRLIFAPRMNLAEHLARHRQADLFLDTFYYNAHTTASDALWAGLPVVTCLGNTFAGRVAASLLQAIGLPELITRNHEEYESLALKLATNPNALDEVKRKLTNNRSTHPLFNTTLFTSHIEAAYTAMWRRHQQGAVTEHIYINP